MAMLRNLLPSPENGLACIKKLKSGYAFLELFRFNNNTNNKTTTTSTTTTTTNTAAATNSTTTSSNSNSSNNSNNKSKNIISMKLVYAKHGDPTEVVKCEEVCLEPPGANDVVLKMLAAPVNPSDINTIQGLYPIRPKLPAVPGNEGVGEVIQLGSSVGEELKVGDKVIPKIPSFGTWRKHAICTKDDVKKVNEKLDAIQAATLTVNPPTAYRLLKDFVQLQPNDTVFQNGANSSVGQYIIQMCKVWGYKSINIVRDRDDIKQLKKSLKDLGATCVFTEEELKATDIFRSGALEKPMLALNCVGGKMAKDMLRHIKEGGTMVTYGGMSREPLTLPASAFIFNNIQFRGFWITQWNQEHEGTPEQQAMMEEITNMFVSGQLQVPAHKLVPLDNYKEVLQNTLNKKGFVGGKYIFDFVEEP